VLDRVMIFGVAICVALCALLAFAVWMIASRVPAMS
jgi:hypothetical protein